MPELPEVETTLRGIEPHILNSAIAEVKIHNGQLRWPVEKQLPQLITNKKILKLERRGKYLLLQFKHGTILWHLGMSGSMKILKKDEPRAKHDHIEILFKNKIILRYNDPRRFGALIWTEEDMYAHKLLNHLGPEPLTNDFNDTYLYEQSRKKKQKVKSWIMDSSLVVGVGNIYANESLFMSGINPNRAAGKLTKSQCEAFVREIKKVLRAAIKQGGTTLKDFSGSDGKPGYFAQKLNVYGKAGKPCPNCNKALIKKEIAQRATYYCTQCQK